MKRIGNIFNKIYDFDNLVLAEKHARKDKTGTYGVRRFDKNPHWKLVKLQRQIVEGTYKTSEYDIFTIIADRGKKERIIYRLPYFPDRIMHHAIMNIIEPILIARFTKDTYSCIKGRGIHAAAKAVKHSLKTDPEGTKYCLKFDIKKFFPSINRDIMMDQFRRIFKDRRFLKLIEEIIYSVDSGMPIGNYISQFAANLYLTWFDRFVKQDLKVKHYFRYCDDVVILASTKEELNSIRTRCIEYINQTLKLRIKDDWQIFPVDVRGIDFVGYVMRHKYCLLRKDMKKKFYHKSCYKNKERRYKALASYWGWCKYGNCHNLWKKYTGTNNIKELKRLLLGTSDMRKAHSNNIPVLVEYLGMQEWAFRWDVRHEFKTDENNPEITNTSYVYWEEVLRHHPSIEEIKSAILNSKAYINMDEIEMLSNLLTNDENTKLQFIKAMKLEAIKQYDSSFAVNCFYMQGYDNPMWLDKATRVGLVNSATVEKQVGKETTELWYEDIKFTLPVDMVLNMLLQIEIYAKDCYNVTQQHLVNVNNINTIELLMTYDHTVDYPDKITFTLN